jgi:hypothetical protein
MVKPDVPMGEDNILPNCTDIDKMEKSSKGIPVNQEMHVSTLRALIHMCNLVGSLVVHMNSSTSMSSRLFFGSLNHSLCSFVIKILLYMITL